MSKNRNLNKAKVAKNDEFYTRLTDIEKEMKHYKAHFKGKTIFCPCDDPYASNFFKYFAMNFEHLGLKRLITACYRNTDLLTRSAHDEDRAIWLDYRGDKNGNRVPDPDEIGVHYFDGDGDFRSEESLALMREADIVVTNPPFSLFREFMDHLFAQGKKFLVIGNMNTLTTKELWPYFFDGKVWFGNLPRPRKFVTPNDDHPNTFVIDGTRYADVAGSYWFTNLSHQKRSEELICYKRYDPDEYPTYDNFDAIEVGSTKYIPCDYDGIMGVPISFLTKHNPDQFEIVGSDKDLIETRFKLDGKTKYARIAIRHRRPATT